MVQSGRPGFQTSYYTVSDITSLHGRDLHCRKHSIHNFLEMWSDKPPFWGVSEWSNRGALTPPFIHYDVNLWSSQKEAIQTMYKLNKQPRNVKIERFMCNLSILPMEGTIIVFHILVWLIALVPRGRNTDLLGPENSSNPPRGKIFPQVRCILRNDWRPLLAGYKIAIYHFYCVFYLRSSLHVPLACRSP